MSDEMDSVIAQKRDQMIAKLNQQSINRAIEKEKRINQSINQSANDPESKIGLRQAINQFLEIFSQQRAECEQLIKQSNSQSDDQSNNQSNSQSNNQSILDSLSALQSYLNLHSHFLPVRDLAAAQQSINQLQSLNQSNKQSNKQSRKFKFRSLQLAAAQGIIPSDQSNNQSVIQSNLHTDNQPIKQPISQIITIPGFYHLSHLELTLPKQTLNPSNNQSNNQTINSINLSHLRHCSIRLCGVIDSLRIDSLIDCSISCGPIRQSVLIDRLVDCSISLSCHQIRIHRAKRCIFELFSRSHPIIEHSDELIFTPLVHFTEDQSNYQSNNQSINQAINQSMLLYPEIIEDCRAARLLESPYQINAAKMTVKDFDWLSNTVDPHWRWATVSEIQMLHDNRRSNNQSNNQSITQSDCLQYFQQQGVELADDPSFTQAVNQSNNQSANQNEDWVNRLLNWKFTPSQ